VSPLFSGKLIYFFIVSGYFPFFSANSFVEFVGNFGWGQYTLQLGSSLLHHHYSLLS